MSDNGPDRWKCPGCGKIVVDPVAPIAKCGCGCDRIQLRSWPNGGEDWEAPEWPEWSDYSPDPFEVESDIDHEWGKRRKPP
jgi:hypothetical protein